jgi:hypothetical protein
VKSGSEFPEAYSVWLRGKTGNERLPIPRGHFLKFVLSLELNPMCVVNSSTIDCGNQSPFLRVVLVFLSHDWFLIVAHRDCSPRYFKGFAS